MSNHTARMVIFDGEQPHLEITCNAPDDAECHPVATKGERRTCDVRDWYADLTWEAVETVEELSEDFQQSRSTVKKQPLSEFDFDYRWEGYGEDAEFYFSIKPKTGTQL